MNERRRILGNTIIANSLYSTFPYTCPGGINAIGIHLFRAHGLKNSRGFVMEGPELSISPPDKVIDQVFRCTTSPVFHPYDKVALCDVQQVAVLVNRLRDRRIMYLLAHLAKKTASYIWMSGPPHYEMALQGLNTIANEQKLEQQAVSAALGLSVMRDLT